MRVHTCKQLPSNICACVVCRLALRCTRLCVSRGRTGKQGGFGAFGKANAMKSHFAFCLPCMTGDRASHKWGLTFHLAEGEEGSWHWGKATPWICGHTKRPGLGFWGHKECMGTRVGTRAGVHSRGELAELWGWGGFFLNSFSAVLGNSEAAQTRVNPSRNIQLVSGDQDSFSLILTTTAGV